MSEIPMNLRFPILVFDIETLTDLKAGAHLYHLDLPDTDVEQALTKIRRQESGMDFQRLPLHEIVCISGLWIVSVDVSRREHSSGIEAKIS